MPEIADIIQSMITHAPKICVCRPDHKGMNSRTPRIGTDMPPPSVCITTNQQQAFIRSLGGTNVFAGRFITLPGTPRACKADTFIPHSLQNKDNVFVCVAISMQN